MPLRRGALNESVALGSDRAQTEALFSDGADRAQWSLTESRSRVTGIDLDSKGGPVVVRSGAVSG